MAQGMNPQKMLRQMQKMQEDMARVQAELQQESVTASAGGGAVTAKVSGGLELLEVVIDPAAVDPEDVEMLQDVIVAAVNEAMRAAQELAQSRLGTVAGDALSVGDLLSLPVASLKTAHEGWFPAFMDGEAA